MSDIVKTHLKELVAQLPLSPGVYQFIDAEGKVIYVGKAKSLRKRVSSYFVQSKEHSAKVKVLVRQIADIRHIVVDTETDALLLENSLIKSLQPRYNILLKDDKTYPWIVVRNEPFPRVESTRKLVRDGSQYFGPYGSISMQRSVLSFLKEVIPLRSCRLNLSESAIKAGKYSICLRYHLGLCNGPCIGEQTPEEYQELISLVVSILKGDLAPVRRYLHDQMMEAAKELRFEEAQRLKLRIDALDNYSGKSIIVSSKIEDVDIFSLLTEDDDVAYCNYLSIRHGSIVKVQTVRLSTGVESSPEELLSLGIQYIVDSFADGVIAREVIVPMLPTAALLLDGVTFTVPKRGEKLDLLSFSLKSAKIYRAEQRKNLEIKNPDKQTDRLMEAMMRELHLTHPPRHIECFDNSNINGIYPVASCVVFRDGKPARREYRHFNVKTVEGPDDFATMREIVYRRYSRLIAEKRPLPDLIVVDGGKGQLSSAYEVICELGIADKVPIVGLAKRLEEIFFPGDPEPYYLSRTGEPLKVLCYIRDEAHRFGINFHRKKRSSDFICSELDLITGVGHKTVMALIKHFHTTDKVKRATLEELTSVVGASKAKRVMYFFSENHRKIEL